MLLIIQHPTDILIGPVLPIIKSYHRTSTTCLHPPPWSSLQKVYFHSSKMAPPSTNNLASTGYGRQVTVHKFDGNPTTFSTFEQRFCLFLNRMEKNLSEVVTKEGADDVNAEQNYQVYSFLCEHLQDEQFNLIKDTYKDDGRKAFLYLKQYYLGSKDDIIYSKLKENATMQKAADEDISGYFSRIIQNKAALDGSDVKLDDRYYLVLAMNGLPEEYKIFCTILDTPKTRPTFAEFAAMCRSKESEIKSSGDSVMKVSHMEVRRKRSTCYKCGKVGHTQNMCGKLWCPGVKTTDTAQKDAIA